jgi:hypothetical protein
MPIRWDPLLARGVADELDRLLSGARLRALRLDAASRDLVLFFRERTLLWRLHPDRGFPRILDAADPEPDDLKLRGRVRAVRCPPDERVVIMDLLGEDRRRYEIVVELLGPALNAIVVEGESATVRHVLRTRGGRRPHRVGHPYALPDPRPRLGLAGSLTDDEWWALLETCPPPDRPRELIARVAWTSPVNAEAFVEHPNRWRSAVAGTLFEPVVLETPQQPYPFPVTGSEAHRFETLLAAFEWHASVTSATPEPTLGLPPGLLARAREHLGRLEKRIVRLQAQLDGREDPDQLRASADLLLARYADVPPRAHEVTLTGFDGDPRTVELDATLDAGENATSLYARAARSERTAERVPNLLSEVGVELERLRALVGAAEAGDGDPAELRRVLPEVAREAARPNEDAERLPYRRFRSSGGLEIRVGRGARHNDDLTFRHSAPNDIWLHARHTAGAHVILRWAGPGNPPQRDLSEAAGLAALNSRARTSGSVAVDWALRKHVRKPRGAPPGSVLVDRVKTLFVEPDPALPSRLLGEGDNEGD